MKKILYIAIIILLIVSNATVAMADDKSSEIDDYINECMEIIDIPGMSVAIVQNGEVIFEKGYGVEVLGTDAQMTQKTIQAVGSVTKSFTALAMMQLVEQGEVKLDDKATQYLPWFRTLEKEKSDQITIAMLLSHSSGLPTSTPSTSWFVSDRGENSAYEEARSLASSNLLFDPGQSYNYSNAGFLLAGLIIEEVSKMEYEDYIKENILNPLDMNSTSTNIDSFDDLGVLYGHIPYYDSYMPANKIFNTSFLAAGSELRTSAIDMTKYMMMYLDSGKYDGKRILSADGISNMMEKKSSTMVMGKETGYGYGLLNVEEMGLVFHGGNTRAMSSMMIMHPETKTGIIMLFNVHDINSEIFGISEMQMAVNVLNILNDNPLTNGLVEEKKEHSGYTLLKKDIVNYLNEYSSSDNTISSTMKEQDGKIYLELDSTIGQQTYELIFESKLAAYATNSTEALMISFDENSNGEIISINTSFAGLLRKKTQVVDDNYKKVYFEDVSFMVPNGYQAQNADDKIIVSSGEVDIEYSKGTGLENFWEDCQLRTQGAGEIVRQTNPKTEWINGYKVYQQIIIIKDGDEYFQCVCAYLEGSSEASIFTIVPYYSTTGIIRDVIVKMIMTIED
ncbi:MAG: beta-lactamase family protein [Clostridiales bacterium]|nr:beta-lactamase family protein [Clostridiales bacterium]